MRYQVHRLQQESLIELGLNTEDALLLDWILNWKDGDSMERIVIEGNDVAYWVNYSKVVEELPILFKKTRNFATEEEAEKAKVANATKVARMLKGNLSKVLTRHERKVQGKTKIYISFDREVIDFLVNGNKKTSTLAEVEVDKKSKPNKSICNTDKNNTTYDKKTQCKKEESEVKKLIDKSCVNISKSDIKTCEEEFTDLNKLEKALEICEENNSNGIKALRRAYKYGKGKVTTQNMCSSKVEKDGKLIDVLDVGDDYIQIVQDFKNGTNFSGYNPDRGTSHFKAEEILKKFRKE